MSDLSDLITIKLPRDLVDQIRPLAVAHNRSLSGELREALQRYIDAQKDGVDWTAEELNDPEFGKKKP